MSSHTDFNVPFIVGDSASDRPAAPAKDSFFFPIDTGVPSFFTNKAWHAMVPSSASVASLTALAAIATAGRYDGQVLQVTDSQTRWVFDSDSVLTGDNLLVVSPTAGTGRWLRAPGSVDLSMAISSGTANGATLLTLQAGMRLLPTNEYWETTIAWSGGSSSAIGLSSSKTGFSTAGDLLGGAAGDVAATLVTGVTAGTIGVGVNSVAKVHAAIFVSGDAILFNRITSAYTTGAGFAHIVADLVANPGA